MVPPPRPQTQSPAPDHIGPYEILVPIASGGMATVYLARSRGLGGFERHVALKLTHAHLREQTSFVTDLVEEAKLAVKIRHTNVVSTLDIGEDPYGLYLVMDYVEGDSLAGLLRRTGSAEPAPAEPGAPPGPELPPAHGLRILLDALAGLHAAHELRGDDGAPLGLVHRDFSPQNILVGIDGMSRLADFGIAKAATRLGHTQTGTLKGKIGYMSPEQARGQRIDRRCDLWAAGVIAWEIFAGRRMYPSDMEELTVLLKVVTEPAPRLRAVRPEVPQAVDDAVARALTVSVDDRWPTAAAFAKGLLDACRAGGMLPAEHADVGALVQALAGHKLARRRAHAAEVAALHERKSRLTAVDETQSGVRPPSPSVPLPPPAALAAADTHEDEAPTVARAPLVSIETAVLPPPPLAEPSPNSSSYPTVPAAPPAHGEVTKTANLTIATSIPARAGTPMQDPMVRRAVLAGVAVVALAGVIAVWVVARSSSAESDVVAASSATGAPLTTGGTPAPPAAAPAGASEAPSSAPAPAVMTAEAPAPQPEAAHLTITADAPIAAVRVGSRRVLVASPAREVTVDLTGDEAGRALHVDAVSVDGRHASADLEAGVEKASLKLPSSSPAPAPLAPSPYKRHP